MRNKKYIYNDLSIIVKKTLFFCYALCLNKPLRTAYFAMYYDVWHTWKTTAEYCIYHLIVAYVAQIHNKITYVGHLGIAFGKQSLYVFKQSVRLTFHIAQI